jgi:YVTN family beta-propeller protein
MADQRTMTWAAVAPIIALVSLAAIVGCDVPKPAGAGPTRPDVAVAPAPRAAAANRVDPVDRPKPGPFAQYHDHQGVRVAFEMLPVEVAPDRPASEFREADDVRFRFTLTDASSGVGVANAHPAAWVALRTEGEPRDALGAAKSIARYIRGDRLFRPTLDLNIFYVLTMNDDASVTVVDPLFGFGNTRLLALVPLKGNAQDWVLSEDQSRLYIATPSADRITVVDTASWSEVASVAPVRRASRLALQSDGHYLWAAYDDAGGESGVAVIASDGATLVRSIPTGRGPHEIAFDRDDAHAFVTNRGDGTVSVVDVRALKKVVDVPSGNGPASIAYSAASQMLYVTHAGDGTIAVLDPGRLALVGRMRAEPGLGEVRFAPGGRLGFAVNPEADVVHVLDAAIGRIVQTADTMEEPDEVSFAGRLAYIHHRGTAAVRVIPIDTLGGEGKPVSVVDFPGGQNAPNARNTSPSLAASIVPVSGESAVLVANPVDKTIYFYKEGMAAPMGSFSNYKRIPRAVLTIDRSLRERRPGVYETVGRLPAPGEYNLAFLLDTPRIAHYFDVSVKPDPARAKRVKSKILVEPLEEAPSLVAGMPARLRFRISDSVTGDPKDGLEDVTVLAFSPPAWQRRYHATPSGEGTYTIEMIPPHPSAYYLYAESPTAGVRLNQHWFLTLDVKPKEAAR